MNTLAVLRARFRAALEPLTEEPDRYADLVRPAQEPRFGDYQANCAMPLAGVLKKPPRQVARELVDRLDAADMITGADIAGPGFINMRLRDDWLAAHLKRISGSDRLDVPLAQTPRTYVIDFSAPNIAKPMHVGHLRSTVIGSCLYNLLGFLGHRAISDNHVGDWGTQFGMVLVGFKRFLDREAYEKEPVAELERLYREVNERSKHDTALAEAAREETAKLHAGDPENRRLWESFLEPCLAEIERIYDRLDVHFDHTLGESFYNPMLPDVVADLKVKGIAEESEGALCIFFKEDMAPAIIRKSDGAFTYSTTDLATVKYRIEHFHPDSILYVVDQRQSDHFRGLFAAVRRWGYQDPELVHVSFGTILGEDGRPFRTREGGTVGLEHLLDEGVERARAVVDSTSPHLGETERRRVAEAVGIGAIKYADLSQNRTSDYVFNWNKMLAMQGNTATYLQYAYARIRSIFRKGGVDAEVVRQTEGLPNLDHPAERELAVALSGFAETLESAAAEYRPNLVTNYVYSLAEKFTAFYNTCPVLKAEPAMRTSRLLLCDLTARTLACGLKLLGIRVVEQM